MKTPSAAAGMLTLAVVALQCRLPANYLWFHCKEKTSVTEMAA